jgi:signal peptidase
LLTVKRIVAGVLLLIAVIVWFVWLRPGFLGGPASYIVVEGTSMLPTLRTGDLAVLRRQETYQNGDIVAFRVEGGVVIHRIIGGTPEGYSVKGDNANGPDMWQPTAAQIAGRMWLHIPGAGSFLLNLRQPTGFAILVGGVTALFFLGSVKRKARRKIRRQYLGGRTMQKQRVTKTQPANVPGKMMMALIVCSVAGLALAGAAVYSFRQPLEQSRLVERLRYEHTGTYNYTVQTENSTLYPSGTVGPIVAPSDGKPAKSPPIYTRLARSLDLGFNYLLKGSVTPDVSGVLSATLEVKAGEEGWAQTMELLPAAPFSGPVTSLRVPIDFAQIWKLIETVEKETGFSAGTYDVSVIPTVHVRGNVGTEAIDETYSPVFAMKLNRTQITIDPQLTRSEVKTFTSTLSQQNDLSILGLSMPVITARWISAVGAALALLAAAALAMVVFLGTGLGKAAQIRARYGGILVCVEQTDLNEEGHKVEVASIEDLVRMARTDGRPIFHQELSHSSHRYFIRDGLVTYEYMLKGPREEA